MKRSALFAVVVILFGMSVGAQSSPPERLSYQGVLRTTAGAPFSGNVDMTFRIYTTETGGTAIWEEVYDDAAAPPANHNITVANGLFSVQLGDYEHVPTYTGSFGEIFNRTDLWLGVTVGTDGEMTPRVKLASSGFALNALALAGKPANRYADTQADNTFTFDQVCPITVWPATTPSFGNFRLIDLKKAQPDATSVFYADIDGDVTQAGTHLIRPLTPPPANTKMIDLKNTIGVSVFSVDSEGDVFANSLGGSFDADTLDGRHAAYFLDTSSTTQVKTGKLVANNSSGTNDYGIVGYGTPDGTSAGAWFVNKEISPTGSAFVGYNGFGIWARGTDSGGWFSDINSSGEGWVGRGDIGVEGIGNTAGALFTDRDTPTSQSYLGSGGFGIKGYGPSAGGYFESVPNSSMASLAQTGVGVSAQGSQFGAVFSDADGSGQAKIGWGDLGIQAEGYSAGGQFDNISAGGTAKALLAYKDAGDVFYGTRAIGSSMGGFFANADTSPSAYARVGANVVSGTITGPIGVAGYGTTAGGYFRDSDSTGEATVGFSNDGIQAKGSNRGGAFGNTLNTSFASVAYGSSGIDAWGSTQGGLFSNGSSSPTAVARLGAVYNPGTGAGAYGIAALGDTAGGYFGDSNGGTGYAVAGTGNRGIEGYGTEAGGYFREIGDSSRAFLGYAGKGVDGSGPTAGGYFNCQMGSGYAQVGFGNQGIAGHGSEAGGYFEDTNNTGYAYVGYGDVAIDGYGTGAGAHFLSPGPMRNTEVWLAYGSLNYGLKADGGWTGGVFSADSIGIDATGGTVGIMARGGSEGAYLTDSGSGNIVHVAAFGTYKIQGGGTNAFAQNHPTDKNRIIVYASPEGDEVATYTRGTARLENGRARVALGETFQWVTNPDLGLTAQVTAREACQGLFVEAVTPTEIVVRELGEGKSSARFDYVVTGLRIGFEEISIVQDKKEEYWIPSFAAHRERYAKYPELRAFNPLERFKTMESVAGLRSSFDLSASKALHDAVHEYDPAVDGPFEPVRPAPKGGASGTSGRTGAAASKDGTAAPTATEANAETRRPPTESVALPAAPSSVRAERFPVAPSVTKGDLLVMIPNNGEELHPCASASDPMVTGIAVTDAVDGFAGVAGSGYLMVKADASPAPIARGDLLVASPFPGHAMKAIDPKPGTIVGKALEPLAFGTKPIKVLVMLR
jgi:hypothetical protein